MKAYTTLFSFIATFFLVGTPSFASINFQTVDIESVFDNAQESNKFIFVEFSAEKCGPCVWMETNVFTDPQVARFINVNFISVKSNGISTNSKFEKYKYNIQMFPTLLFLSPSGEEIIRIEGKTDAINLEDVARLVLEGNTEELIKLIPKKKEDDKPNPNNDFPDYPKRIKVQAILND